MQTSDSKTKEGVVGPSIAISIILIMITMGAIYYWNTVIQKKVSENSAVSETKNEQKNWELPSNTNSDALADIEKELNSIDVDNTDKEINDIIKIK